MKKYIKSSPWFLKRMFPAQVKVKEKLPQADEKEMLEIINESFDKDKLSI
jgi:hypothetical protein